MTTYRERVEKQMNFVLQKGGQVLGTFGNLRKLSKFMEDEEGFPSYWTLIRKDDFPIVTGEYTIHRVKHH